jgi:alanine dehydrogenase
MNELGKLASQAMISPKEMLFEKKKNAKSLFIGIPKEISLQEKRICLTPLAVALLVENGHEVIIETGAGAGANF